MNLFVGRRFSRPWGGAIVAAALLASLLPTAAFAAPGVASQLAILSVNGSASPTAGTAFSVVVQAQDDHGNGAAVAASTTITLTLATGSGTLGGTLAGTLNPGGPDTVTISGVTYTKAETNVQIRATATSGDPLGFALSGTFTVLPGAAAKVAVTSVNGGANPTVNVAFSVAVEAQDANGNRTNVGSNTAVSLTSTGSLIGSPTGTITTGTASTTIGVTFSAPGTGVTLTTSSGLAAGTSAAFNVMPRATRLAITSVNGGSSPTATVAFTVVVQARDDGGNVANVVVSTGVSLTRNTGTGSVGGITSGTISAGTSSVTISGVTYSKAEPNVSLLASRTSGDTPIAAGASASFTVLPRATKLAIITINGGVSPSALGPFSVVVQAQDANGAAANVEASTGVLLSKNTGSGTLSGNLTGTISAGTSSVTISGVVYSVADTNVRLDAARTSGDDLSPGTSSAFTVLVTYHLAFTTQPGGGAPGVAWTQQPIVAVTNALGQVITTDNSTVVTLAIGTNPASGTLTCTGTGTGGRSKTVVNGYATFTGCSINVASASAYTLTATSSPTWTSATSSTFTISALHLAFTTQPGGGPAGAAWGTQPIVAVMNSSNQVMTSDSSTVVTLSIATNPAGGTLTCTNGTSRTVVHGYASFSGCSINLGSASAYTLTATSNPAWTAATSATFLVGAQHLAFTTQPGGGLPGTVWVQQPVVGILSSLNQVVTTDSTTLVTLALGSNPTGATLSCTSGTTVRAVSGYARFYGCSINLASASYYTLVATSNPAFTSATSSAFLVGTTLKFNLTGTALGNTTVGPFTFPTKIQKIGGYITWRFDGGPAVGNQTIQIWVYKKYSLYGSWTGPILLTTRKTNASGIAYANIRTYGILWLSVRPVLPATLSTPSVWGPTSIGRWIR